MRLFFGPNLNRTGRWLRAGWGTLLAAGGMGAGWAGHPGLGVLLLLAGGFAWWEAARGWCVLRSCGIKTRY